MDSFRRARAAILLTAAFLIPALLPPSQASAAPEVGKIVVLGFDGADARLTERWMDEGRLPNLARLRDGGTYAPLYTTMPPQTPVSWSAFSTGRNPGRTGIFDFLRRDLDTYQPDFAMYVIGSRDFLWGRNNHLLTGLALLVLSLLVGVVLGAALRRPGRALAVSLVTGVVLGGAAVAFTKDWLPHRRPTVENTRKGDTFWEVAGQAGHASKIVRVPATFPPEGFPNGHLLSGLGVPDIRGTFGTFSFYTTETLPDKVDENTEMGGKIIEVALVNGETDSYIYGPRNRLFDEPEEILPPVHFKVDRAADPPTVTITTEHESQTVPLGGWSDWFTVEFTFSPVVKVYGTTRFNFISSDPFGLYMSSVNLDPHRPVMPVSVPEGFSRYLAERFGMYKTLGWSLDTWALNELRIDEETFLEDVYSTEGKFAEIMRGLLADGDFRIYVHVYELTDRVAHVFWRLMDEEHPAYDAGLAERYGDAIFDTYRFMDDIVGEVAAELAPEDLLIVLSDHGFHTWHKAVNYNTWLVKNGFMALKNNEPDTEKTLEDLFGQGQFWPNVDWSRTKAYALGLGDIYINLKGREAQGIVEPGEEYDRIRNEIVTRLEGFQDPETGDFPVRTVYRREDIYAGYDEDLIPDLLAANNPKYRVSWQTSLGGIPQDLFQLNDRKWSADHCSMDPAITEGILFVNRRWDTTDVTILDLYPTILNYLGIASAEDVDGKVLRELE